MSDHHDETAEPDLQHDVASDDDTQSPRQEAADGDLGQRNKIAALVDFPRTDRHGWRRWIPKWQLVAGGAITASLAVLLALAAAVFLAPMPTPSQLALAQSTTFYWNDGTTVLGRTGEANRTSLDFEQIPAVTAQAVLAAEDRSFYSHTGFDVVGIARAARNNIFGSGEGTQGGSTITQQYAKNAFLTQDQTLVRKAKELIISLKLELTSSKEQILTNYLNTVYYGRGAYGIEAAAKEYFGISAGQLDASQSAMLAALIASPNALSPESNLAGLEQRWEYVLDSMVSEGSLSPQERAAAEFPHIEDYRPLTQYYEGPNGFLLAAAQQELLEKGFTEEDLTSGGLSVVTTFDQPSQFAAIMAVQENMPPGDVAGLRIGMAAVATDTGAVKALYGGSDYAHDKFNNATQARGPAGSTFKAFGLAAGLSNGVTLDTNYSGASPMTIYDYKVANYGNQNYGNVNMLTSTVNSVNTPFVQMNADIGGERTWQTIVDAGIPADTPGLGTELNNILGSASPTPLEQARAFATFATRGERLETTMIGQVRDQDGAVVYQWQPKFERAIDERVADQVTFALRRVVNSGTGTAALSAGRPVAGKTGTSDDFKSAWFVGYTPQQSAAVMMVRNDAAGNAISLSGIGGMTEVTGGSIPARIFGDYMAGAMNLVPVQTFAEPRGQVAPLGVAPRNSGSQQWSAPQVQSAPVQPAVPTAPLPAPQETAPLEPAPQLPAPPPSPSPVAPSPPVPQPPVTPTPTQSSAPLSPQVQSAPSEVPNG